ncbi:MAG: chromosome segregation protein SMC [Parachlamydiaceae bacterium]|nr:chromosome segregation protein SMC [Parachlamydiaceae bacterium]
MRLKKIVLVGFKSFAEKTVLNFDAGITCIVGPNGCGKSNIADAFRWVLGEQSPKSLRGNKMPDFIFAGSNNRKPLNLAEVSLTLTDIHGALPIDYEEVTLTRRLHRNGESEYLLNGNIVRLKDLQSLFLDSGVGRNAFSIFEQGKIDQVINFSPVERRYIFEEAAGILRFLQRKREALKRLEQADLNFSRVHDIHHEVEQQITVLKDQAEKAKRFKENKEQLEQLEKASYVLRWNHLESKWVDGDQRLEKQQKNITELHQSISNLQHRNGEMKALMQQEEKNLRSKNEELFKIRSEKEIHARDHLSNEQRLQETEQKEKKLKRELEELKLSQLTRQKTLVDIQVKQKKTESEYLEADNKLTSQRDKVKLKEKEVSELRGDLQTKQQQHLKQLQIESQLASEHKQSETRLENLVERKKHLENRKDQSLEDVKHLSQMVQEKKLQLGQISSLVDTHKERLEDYEDKLKSFGKELESKQQEIDDLQRKTFEQRARQKVLLRLRDDHEGFSSGSKKLLQESDDPNSVLSKKIRPLYEFFTPVPEEATALAVVLRNYAQTLVVDTEEDLKLVLDFARKKKIQDYSLLCVELVSKLAAMNKTNSKGYFTKIKSNPVAQHLLGNVVESDDFNDVFTLLQKSVSCEIWNNGDVYIDQKGVFFQVKANENHVFLRESELKGLEEELLQKEDQMHALSKKLQSIQDQKSKVQMERTELDKMLRRDEMKLVEINFGYQRCMTDLDKIKAEQVQIEKDLLVLNQQIEQLQQLVKQLQDKYYIVKQDLSKFQEEILFLNQELEKQMSLLRTQLQDQKEKGDLFQQLSEERQKLVHQLNVLEIKEQEYHKQEQHFLNELADIEELQSKIKERGPQFHQSMEFIEMRLKQASEACLTLEKKIEIQKTSIEQIEKDILKQQELQRKCEAEGNQYTLQVAQNRSSAQSLEHELQERYQLTIDEAKKVSVLDKTLEQAEKQIRSLRQSIQAAGDINMASIDDLDKHETRFTFLKQQLEDMSMSKQELLEIISQVDGESRKLFKQTFDAIRENFRKNYQILFNGGEADLQFTETDNILEAGIEIIAKPPGKQMRSISLLSGGEKCLTAVALLFAIFQVKPSPFCILDEIDAPLDDTNVERFTNMIKHFINRCQFLIITHNKRTMAIGDVLFGVSMEEKGVSKLLSLDFAHTEAPEASLI